MWSLFHTFRHWRSYQLITAYLLQLPICIRSLQRQQRQYTQAKESDDDLEEQIGPFNRAIEGVHLGRMLDIIFILIFLP